MLDNVLNFKTSRLSIVVPVFNEAPQIVRNLDVLLNEVERYFTNFEIIVVSDGSTDGTNSKIMAYQHPGLKPIVVGQNAGKGNAVRSGFKSATGDYILFIDGGLEIHPKEIRIFMGLMALYECDIVIGSKRHPQSQVEYPWYRRALSGLFQLLIRGMFQINVTDTQVGIKLFRRPVIDAILPHLEVNRYGFDLEILCLAKRKGFDQVLEAPIRMDYFNGQQRFLISDLLHVFKVGFSLLRDTWALYSRLKTIEGEVQPASENKIKRAG